MVRSVLVLLAGCCLVAAQQPAAGGEDAALVRRIDAAVTRVLAATGTPSVSIAVIRDGKMVLTRAWGLARETPRVAATPDTRYAIGSISKQFSAAAILLLQQDGKLRLDDRVGRHLPGLPHGNDVTIRQLLAHTAGYEDYWPQEYVPPYMRKAADVPQILKIWAARPLTIPPGQQWQYSNTNYVVAGAIVEKVSGVSLFELLRARIFRPLGMSSVFDFTKGQPPALAAEGYSQYGLGPRHPAPKEANAWLFAAGDLAMTAKDLALWDLSIISRSVLDSASYREQETEVRRADGTATGYGLGVQIGTRGQERTVWHAGGVSGFEATNIVYPTSRAAVSVLANGEFGAVSSIAQIITGSLFAAGAQSDNPQEWPRILSPMAVALSTRPAAVQARTIFESLQQGKLDRSRFSENGNAYFTRQAVDEFAASLAPLGPPMHFWQASEEKLGPMTGRRYYAWFADRTLFVSTIELSDGRFEQFLVTPVAPMWR